MERSTRTEVAELEEIKPTMRAGRQKARTTPWVVLIGAIAVLTTGLYLWANTENAELEAAMYAADQEQGTSDQRAALLDRLVEIDGDVIVHGDLQAALINYRALQNDLPPELETAVQSRIAGVERRLAQRAVPEAIPVSADPMIEEYQARITELQTTLEQVNNSFFRTRDSLRAEKDAIAVKLSKANRDLASKEKTQVITFSGVRGHKIHYLGEVSNGKANGGGVGIWSTGSVYRGQWENGVRHGSGVFEWEDGQRYEGEYVHGIREGQGTYYWPGGDRYEGQWRGDKRNGQGILYDMDGNVRYEGEWVDDKSVGGKS